MTKMSQPPNLPSRSPPNNFNILKVNKLSLLNRIATVRQFINTKQKRLVRRLTNYLRGKRATRVKVKNFPEKLFRLNLSSFKFEIGFYFDLIKEVCKERLLLKLMKAHYIAKAKHLKVTKKVKTLPSQKIVSETIKKLYQTGKKSHALLVILMFLTGRRSIDLLRLRSGDVKQLDSSLYAASIEKDKKHAYKLHFKIDLKFWDIKWCGIKKKIFGLEFSKLLKKRMVFGNICKASLSREVGAFQPHILRSIRAMVLLKRGFSVEEVLGYIGWDDKRSLFRYVKLDVDMVRRLEWTELRKIFNKK